MFRHYYPICYLQETAHTRLLACVRKGTVYRLGSTRYPVVYNNRVFDILGWILAPVECCRMPLPPSPIRRASGARPEFPFGKPHRSTAPGEDRVSSPDLKAAPGRGDGTLYPPRGRLNHEVAPKETPTAGPAASYWTRAGEGTPSWPMHGLGILGLGKRWIEN